VVLKLKRCELMSCDGGGDGVCERRESCALLWSVARFVSFLCSVSVLSLLSVCVS